MERSFAGMRICARCFRQSTISPVQVIQPPSRFQLSFVDLSRLPADDREQQAAELAQQDAVRRFDLAYGPLMRLMLLKWTTMSTSSSARCTTSSPMANRSES